MCNRMGTGPTQRVLCNSCVGVWGTRYTPNYASFRVCRRDGRSCPFIETEREESWWSEGIGWIDTMDLVMGRIFEVDINWEFLLCDSLKSGRNILDMKIYLFFVYCLKANRGHLQTIYRNTSCN